ncbi:GNAT family N-acetyltransferase [Stackebrandtia nassauensis]|uniref:GCN5-related N-acetyltransferase n=1 Tax=Stackebrandtia nassauensis (strain DSM 44728 / CIP 108903 / NRRL B-16338 / NBRC 102104 / LLR-40K-21) TaxID=446470 RepID=D3PXI2_STANL|nr:GNAT family N-acetyltransferase [Stackebrandtia nassauensis]ADD43312.1 GCN5-related N-acetyltransferase [Stackebrandtia nassauensis DSM 44728]
MMDSRGAALTRDGHVIGIRPVQATDAAGLAACHRHADEHDLRWRFFSYGADSVEREVKRLLRPASEDFAALVALDHERIIAVASYERGSHDRGHAVAAVFVDPRHHGRGIATLLLERLGAVAAAHGVRRLSGHVRADNYPMLKVACGLSADAVAPAIGSTVEVELPTVWIGRALDEVGERERVAKAASLTTLMRPRVVAVMGTGLPRHGPEMLRAIMSHGFTGRVYAVSAHGGRMAGLDCHPSLADLPEPVDLAVIAMPEIACATTVDETAAAGVRAAILTGDVSATVARDLVERARRHDLRLLGPGSLGLITTATQVRLTACTAPVEVDAGTVALSSRSASVGSAMLAQAARRGLGIGAFVCRGSGVDIDDSDLLSYWHDDPHCHVVALCLDALPHPRGFARLTRSVSRRKPVIALPAEAADTWDAWCAYTGVIGVSTVDEMLDTAAMLTGQPTATGDRVAVVGNARGLNELALAAATRAGLFAPALSPGLRERLRMAASATDTATVDLDVAVSAEAFGGAISTLATSGEVDVLAVNLDVSASGDVPWYLDTIAETLDATGLPIAVVLTGIAEPPRHLGKRHVPVFALPEPAMTALGHVVAYAHWRREPEASGRPLPSVDDAGARRLVDAAVRAGAGPQSMDWTARLLAMYGIPVAASHATTSVGRAAGAIELAAAIVRDRSGDAMVMLGLGGANADLIDDRVYRYPPLTDAEAGRMWRSLRAAALLRGDAVDTDEVEDLVSRLARLADDVPEIAELSLDPILAGPDGLMVVNAELRLTPDATTTALAGTLPTA